MKSVQENKEIQGGKTNFFLSLECEVSYLQSKRILSVEFSKCYLGSIHDTSNAAN